jgi:hypothetical protein
MVISTMFFLDTSEIRMASLWGAPGVNSMGARSHDGAIGRLSKDVARHEERSTLAAGLEAPHLHPHAGGKPFGHDGQNIITRLKFPPEKLDAGS